MRNVMSLLYTPFCPGFILMGDCEGKSKPIYGRKTHCLRSLMKSSAERRQKKIGKERHPMERSIWMKTLEDPVVQGNDLQD